MGRFWTRSFENHRPGIHLAKIGKHGMEMGWDKLEKSERVGVGARVDATTEREPGGGMGSIGSVAMATGGGATGGEATGSGVSATVTVE
jgi:hypothetical protein